MKEFTILFKSNYEYRCFKSLVRYVYDINFLSVVEDKKTVIYIVRGKDESEYNKFQITAILGITKDAYFSANINDLFLIGRNVAYKKQWLHNEIVNNRLKNKIRPDLDYMDIEALVKSFCLENKKNKLVKL